MIAAKTRKLLQQHNIVLKKSLGQNFLTATHVLEQIIASAELDQDAGVIEIGPGIGALTEGLSAQAKQVIAVELDQRLVPVLQELFQEQPNVDIIHADALQLDFAALIEERFATCSHIHIVANLPYYITSPIIVKLLKSKLPLTNIVIMIQKEVADRLLAAPNSKMYGSLSVFAQYFSEPSKVIHVPSHVFVPRPKVDSTVLKLTLRKQPIVKVVDESFFFEVVRAAFAKRRKTLLNSLSSSLSISINKTELTELLHQVGIDPSCRGETLSMDDFARLANTLIKWKQQKNSD
jgi:16S rRNA (adenine1518-N6/adenine1519-N6)-dimethyltransferase